MFDGFAELKEADLFSIFPVSRSFRETAGFSAGFFAEAHHNPLKCPIWTNESKEIKGNPSSFLLGFLGSPWIGLDRL